MTSALALRVSREEAESARLRLRAGGLLDADRAIVLHEGRVLLPQRSQPMDAHLADVVTAELPPQSRPRPPIVKIREAARLPARLRDHLPKRWKRLGDVVVVRIPRGLWDNREEVGRAFGQVLRATAVLAEVGGIGGPLREPQVERIWGEATEAVVIENGVRFTFDAERIMFSSGNLRERIRMGTMPAAGETVVDLFAGIGYFAIPMGVHSRARRIIACELNPDAFRYLVENCRLNRASSIEPRLGDCREVAPRGVADRVVMGYLDAAPFLPVAFEAIRPHGGWLHYHEAGPDGKPDLATHRVTAAARDAGFRVLAVASRRLKSVGPRVGHWVVDANVAR